MRGGVIVHCRGEERGGRPLEKNKDLFVLAVTLHTKFS